VKEVVTALIIRDDRVLLTQRRSTGSYPWMWEGPGGKVHEGERLVDAMLRELDEEIGLRRYGRTMVTFSMDYFWRTHVLEYDISFYVVRPERRFVPELREVIGCGWFTLEEARQLPLLPGNVALFAHLKDRLP
jgi:8-oxo-dGTP pyrophosphatase MutT (NUDIX family)